MPSPAILPHCHAPLPAEAGDWLLSSHLTLGPLRSAVPCARGHATHVLRDWGLSDASDSVELVVSELITNAVIASRVLAGGPFPVRFWLLTDKQEILILVADSSPHPPGLMKPAEDTEGGRGLMLVEAVSKRWGWFYAAADANEGIYRIVIKVAPAANEAYTLHFANSATMPNVKSWGLKAGTLATAEVPPPS